jgi:hypothetical protein
MFFKNHRSFFEHHEFARSELSTHLGDGRIQRVLIDAVGVCNPQMVTINCSPSLSWV